MGKVNRVQTMVASEAKKLDFILDVVVSRDGIMNFGYFRSVGSKEIVF